MILAKRERCRFFELAIIEHIVPGFGMYKLKAFHGVL